MVEWARHFAGQGYVVVVQDVRGRWESEGEWYPFFNEGRDGSDTIEWVAAQPWCDGSIGMYGGSYAGWVQWAAAREEPVALRALVSTSAAGRWLEEAPYSHGVFVLQFLQWLNLVGGRSNQDNSLVSWSEVFEHLPLRTIDQAINRPSHAWQEWLDHPTLDGYWRELRLDGHFSKINLPVLHIAGWFDGNQPGALYFYRGVEADSAARDEQSLVLGPWDHAGTRVPHREFGPLDFGESSVLDVRGLHIAWFDRHLKGAESEPMPKVRYFVMGRNEWNTDTAWPPAASSVEHFYLTDSGGAGGLASAPGASASHVYTYDPSDPVRIPRDIDSHYQFARYYETRTDADLERAQLEARDDVLVYRSEPLDHEVTIAGKTWVDLYAESDCVDTDWHVWLADHWPDGRSIVVAEGRLAARFRDGLDNPQLLVPGEIYCFRIELTEVAHLFARDHRIALAVTSSSFPRFARNPNTGAPVGSDTVLKVARNRVHLGSVHPSRIELPVLVDIGARA